MTQLDSSVGLGHGVELPSDDVRALHPIRETFSSADRRWDTPPSAAETVGSRVVASTVEPAAQMDLFSFAEHVEHTLPIAADLPLVNPETYDKSRSPAGSVQQYRADQRYWKSQTR